jgi:hypothetical protein
MCCSSYSQANLNGPYQSVFIGNLLIAFATFKQIVFETTLAILLLLLLAYLEIKIAEENSNINFLPKLSAKLNGKTARISGMFSLTYIPDWVGVV